MREISSENFTAGQIKLIRKYLKLRITEDNVTFRGHEQEWNHVYDLMKRAVLQGESHSALLIGPRGSGKTTLVNSVLHRLSKEADITNDAIVVKLNGYMHHDDKVALKSITAQMQLENAVGDRVFGTFAENLAFLLSCLQSGADRRCKSMLFVLEEFDMFCHSARTQTLLYNLFDITHSRQAPMCVLGITNRVDVMEMLEKRVKSRFSHRHIFIFSDEQTKPQDMFADLLVELVTIPVVKKKGRARKKSNVSDESDTDTGTPIPTDVLQRCKVDPQQFTTLAPSFIEDWNAHVRALRSDEKVLDSLEKLCYYTINEQIFKDILFQVVSTLSPAKPFIDATDLTSTIDKTVAPEHKVRLLQSLSVLELSLVIAMKHGMEIFDGQPMNFEMVLHRYTKFANTNSSTQSVPRPVILKAFEHLQALEIIAPVRGSDSVHETTASRVQKEYQLFALTAGAELTDAVKGYRALPTEINHWFGSLDM